LPYWLLSRGFQTRFKTRTYRFAEESRPAPATAAAGP